LTRGEPSDLSDREYQSLARFRYALRRFLHFSEQAARDEGLTPNQHQLLLAIRGWTGETSPSITDVAELLQLRHHSTVGRVLVERDETSRLGAMGEFDGHHSTVELAHRAESAGLVSFHQDPADGRRQLLHVTPTAAKRLNALTVLHRDELRRFRHQLHDLLDSLEQASDQ
jgi:DNA-binding MarR family transcriptional regulator